MKILKLFSAIIFTSTFSYAVTSPYTQNLMSWGPNAMKIKQAWSLSGKGAGIKIIDIGADVDVTHPALAGKVDAVVDFVGDTYFRDFGHGTQINGIIVGAEDSTTGFYGVAPEAHVSVAVVCGVSGCSDAAALQALKWAIAKHPDVIHFSVELPSTMEVFAALDAAEQAGIVIVAASGSDADLGYENVIPFPASYHTVISVGGLLPNLTRIAWSQWSPELSVAAPGAYVFTPVESGTGCDAFLDLNVGGVTTQIEVACYQQTARSELGLTGDIVYVGAGTPADFAGKNFLGKIVVTDSTVSPEDAFQNGFASQPAAIIHINGSNALTSYVIRDSKNNRYPIPMINMKSSDGQALISKLTAGTSVQGKITVNPFNYGTQAGTVISASLVTGLVALIKEANPALTPAQIKTIITTTATSLEPSCGGKCGAGIPNAQSAVSAAINMRK